MRCFYSIESLGELDSLSLQILTWKLALTRPSRSVDLVMLDLRYRRHTPEGVVFQEADLEKQSRQGKRFSSQLSLATVDSAHSRLCGHMNERQSLSAQV